VAGQVQRRVPAARHRQQVGFNLERPANMGARNRGKPRAALGVGDLPAEINRAILDRAGIKAAVDDRRHLHARRHQRPRRGPRAVVIGKNGDLAARYNAVAVQIGPHRPRHHDAGPVVHRKGDGPFNRPRRQHRPPRDNPPETFARQIGAAGFVQPHPFKRRIGAAVIGAGYRGAGHDPHVGQGFQLGHNLGDPFGAGQPVNLAVIRQKPPADAVILIGQNDIRPCPPSGQRGHQAGRPRAHNQQIAKGKCLFVVTLVMLARQAA
jgi:hypothetical protein